MMGCFMCPRSAYVWRPVCSCDAPSSESLLFRPPPFDPSTCSCPNTDGPSADPPAVLSSHTIIQLDALPIPDIDFDMSISKLSAPAGHRSPRIVLMTPGRGAAQPRALQFSGLSIVARSAASPLRSVDPGGWAWVGAGQDWVGAGLGGARLCYHCRWSHVAHVQSHRRQACLPSTVDC